MLLIAAGWAASTAAGPQLPDPGSVSINKHDQEQLGLKAMVQVYQQMPLLPDSSPVTQYIQQLGSKLQRVIPQQYSWPYQFHVVQESDINAFALPGGPVFINVGTINAADSEAELAGVMAHEMSHVYMQHGAKQASKESLAEGILGVVGGILGEGTAADLARAGMQLGAGTILLKYSRTDEAQADAVGAIIMYKAGYDPRALATFFEKLEKQPGSNGIQFLSDHPNPGNRTQAIDNEIRSWPPERYLTSMLEFSRVKSDARGVKTYTAQQIADGAKQGVWAQQNKKAGAVPHVVPTGSGSPLP
jgi:beta-barrel assembly-enhancing protease